MGRSPCSTQKTDLVKEWLQHGGGSHGTRQEYAPGGVLETPPGPASEVFETKKRHNLR
jgi:hypothetical protein